MPAAAAADRDSMMQWVTIKLKPGEAVLLDSRLARRWQQPAADRAEVGYGPWWLDAAVLAPGSATRRRLAAAVAGRHIDNPPVPEPARPPLAELTAADFGDLNSHWMVEAAGLAAYDAKSEARL